METFGELLAEAMDRKGWGDYHVSAAIGLLPGNKVINNTQIRRIRVGERQNLSRELVQRLIEVLDLDEAEAWHAAGMWPPDLDVQGYRQFRQHALAAVGATGAADAASDQPDPKNGPSWRRPGQRRPSDRRLERRRQDRPDRRQPRQPRFLEVAA